MEFLAMLIAEHLLGQSDDDLPRTLLGWTRVGLLAGLIAQVAYLIHTCIALSVPTFLWISILANIVALVVLRRACDLINGQASTGPCGSPVFARAGETDPPSLLILSQTSAGKGIDYVIDSLLVLHCSFVRAWRPFLRPDLRVQRCAARRDRQGWPSRLPCLSRQRCQATP